MTQSNGIAKPLQVYENKTWRIVNEHT